MLYNVGFVSVPCLVAQQNGETEKLIVSPEPVIASDSSAAIAKTAAAHADAINKIDGATLKAIVSQVG